MKNFRLKFLVLLLSSLTFIIACEDEDETVAPSLFVGDYVISEAKVSGSFTVTTNELGEVPVPENTVITPVIQQALLSSVQCDNPANSYIELREDKTIYMSCAGENALLAGTWKIISDTELNLILNGTVIPPLGLPLNVKDIEISGSSMTGNTEVPLPKSFLEQMLPEGITVPDNTIATVSFTIKFIKQ